MFRLAYMQAFAPRRQKRTPIYTYISFTRQGSEGRGWKKYAKCHSDCHPDLLCGDTHTSGVMAISFPQTSDIFSPTVFSFFSVACRCAGKISIPFPSSASASCDGLTRGEDHRDRQKEGKSLTRSGMETIGGIKKNCDGHKKQRQRSKHAR